HGTHPFRRPRRETPPAGRRNRKGPENRHHPHPARPAPPRPPPPGPGLPPAGSHSHRDDLQLSTRPAPHLGTMRPTRLRRGSAGPVHAVNVVSDRAAQVGTSVAVAALVAA